MNNRVVPQFITLDSITATLAAELEQYCGALYGGRRSDISDVHKDKAREYSGINGKEDKGQWADYSVHKDNLRE